MGKMVIILQVLGTMAGAALYTLLIGASCYPDVMQISLANTTLWLGKNYTFRVHSVYAYRTRVIIITILS